MSHPLIDLLVYHLIESSKRIPLLADPRYRHCPHRSTLIINIYNKKYNEVQSATIDDDIAEYAIYIRLVAIADESFFACYLTNSRINAPQNTNLDNHKKE